MKKTIAIWTVAAFSLTAPAVAFGTTSGNQPKSDGYNCHPTTPPVEPPVEPPTNPPTNPPTEPPVTPPTTNPPVPPITNPPPTEKPKKTVTWRFTCRGKAVRFVIRGKVYTVKCQCVPGRYKRYVARVIRVEGPHFIVTYRIVVTCLPKPQFPRVTG